MPLTVKQFCDLYKCDISSMYKKIRRKKRAGELSELNVYKENGITFLDEKAEQILKPILISNLKEEIADREKTIKIYQQSDYEIKSLLDDRENDLEKIKSEYTKLESEYNILQEDYKRISKDYETKISEYENQISKYRNQIDELTEQLSALKKPRKLFG